MAIRVHALDEAEAPLLARPLYWMSRKMLGKVVTPLRVQARRPAIAWLGNLLWVAIERSGRIEPELRMLVCLRAAQLVECPF